MACQQYSDHEDWYHDDDDLTVDEYLTNPPRITVRIVEPIARP